MVLIIDNYDSFVHTLARYVGLLGRQCQLVRNDKITIAQIQQLKPDAIILSPGPGKCENAGICVPLVQSLGEHFPILGVCLGHQAIVVAYGGVVERAAPMHGRSCQIIHDGQGIFSGISMPMQAGRYHSLCAVSLPDCLQKQAYSQEDNIMAVKHRHHPVWGVQIHPESILTPEGDKLMGNFLQQADAFNANNTNPTNHAVG